ncbi:MAG: hypothetical protein CMM46_02135 [Rhodospirillaceae bacterium]|nr:hypothetical protein [Rhodospirillaceae bacterium]|tara:strand:- start:16392 stop:17402 length:1011 start_codon:yes stop_codon:yes gene_type:complete
MSERLEGIATVDIAALFQAGSSGAGIETDRAVLSAMKRCNGFITTGFPRSDELDARIGRLLTFFDLPEDQRMALATRRFRPEASHCYRGFFPLPRSRGWAHNEIFDYGPAMPSQAPDGHPVKVFLEEMNQWPDPAPKPGWADEALALLAELREIVVAVMAALARSLALDVDTFMAAFDDDNGTLRILHYPPVPDDFVAATGEELPEVVDGMGRRIITRSHVDACALSLLWQDDVGGLQYEGDDGRWREVPARPGALSIHCGQALEKMTEGRLKGTPHRVIGTGRDRCSMGMFLEPMFTAVISHDSGAPPITYADHMKHDFAGLDHYADVMGDAVAE